MSRKKNNLKKMKEAKRQRRLHRKSNEHAVGHEGMVRVDSYPNGRKYLSKLGMPRAMQVSGGIETEYLHGTKTDDTDCVLWDLLWMFKSRDVLGFCENSVGVYAVVIDGKRIPLAVEQEEGGCPSVMLANESSALGLSEAECEERLARINDNVDDPREYARRIGAAMSAAVAGATVGVKFFS